jgi:hypothetical protein
MRKRDLSDPISSGSGEKAHPVFADGPFQADKTGLSYFFPMETRHTSGPCSRYSHSNCSGISIMNR